MVEKSKDMRKEGTNESYMFKSREEAMEAADKSLKNIRDNLTADLSNAVDRLIGECEHDLALDGYSKFWDSGVFEDRESELTMPTYELDLTKDVEYELKPFFEMMPNMDRLIPKNVNNGIENYKYKDLNANASKVLEEISRASMDDSVINYNGNPLVIALENRLGFKDLEDSMRFESYKHFDPKTFEGQKMIDDTVLKIKDFLGGVIDLGFYTDDHSKDMIREK